MGLSDLPDDASTKAGARRLADTIVAYWRRWGYAGIQADIEPVSGIAKSLYLHSDASATRDPRPIYTVRTNIGPLGFPPKLAPP